jgi:hypothetical protein
VADKQDRREAKTLKRVSRPLILAALQRRATIDRDRSKYTRKVKHARPLG